MAGARLPPALRALGAKGRLRRPRHGAAAATLKRAEIAEKALAAAEKTIADYEKASVELGARAAALADELEQEKAQHAALVGRVLAPAEAPAPGAASHRAAWLSLRSPAERESYFAAHRAEILAEASATAGRR